MKNIFNLIFLISIFTACNSDSVKSPAEYVDPFIGTAFHGHTYPGATVPFGGVQLSPDTRRNNWDACSGYHYSDSVIFGFSHLHLSGTGAIDLGDVLFHPTTKALELQNDGYIFKPHPFSHENEVAEPGYYAVTLNDVGIKAELTTTAHTGIHRYTFPQSGESKIIVDLHHGLSDETIHGTGFHLSGDRELTGYRLTSGWTPNQHVYFVARFSKPFKSVSLISDGVVIENIDSVSGTNIQAVINYETTENEKIELKVGISVVSLDNARMNLEKEVGNANFDQIKQYAIASWDKALSVIQVEGSSDDNKEIFYTALYHALLMPDLVSDVNGDYRSHDMSIRQTEAGRKMYSTLSLWDTFRTWHPLMTLINDSLVNDMIQSMMAMYDATGELPIWPLVSGETGTMIGYHSVSVIADAYLKGIRGFDAEKAFEAMKVSSNSHRKGGKYYVENGFIPADLKKESVSCLLEYAYDDWCIAQMANAMGKQDDYEEYKLRAQSWMNVFDGQTKFFRGKKSDGNWVNPFNPFYVSRDYTEANAWQYRFFVPHDVNGLVNMFGGREQFIEAFDGLFDTTTRVVSDIPDVTGLIGQYAHGNEPSHHMAYVYSFVEQPWRTQQMVRRVLDEMYSSDPDGIAGNEDCGQMSAWYIMSSLGIYPVAPGSGEYVFSSPLFEKAEITLHNGKKLTIKANDPEKNLFIGQVFFNGEEVTENFITHESLMQGGELKFVLVKEPQKNRGVLPSDKPYSMSTEPMVSVPFIRQDVNLFVDEIMIEMGTATADASIHFTLDGSDPDEESTLYEAPIKISSDTHLKLRAFKKDHIPSKIFSISATRAVFKEADKKNVSEKGVRYTYYEGVFSSVYDMTTKKALKSGVMNQPVLETDKDDHFGYIYTGLLKIDEDAIYDFYTISDDGSVLEIGNKLVVMNDGSHSAIKASGRIALKKGYHAFKFLYFEDYEGHQLEWGMKKSTDEAFEPIKADYLFVN